VLEMEDKIILKRGISSIVIPDKGAMIVIKVIQKALAQSNYTSRELTSFFSNSTHDLVLSFINNLIKRRFIVPVKTKNDERTPISEDEDPQDIFYWHFNKYQKGVSKLLNEKPIAFIGINELNKRMIAALIREGKKNIIVIDDPSLRKIEFFNNDFKCIDLF